MIDRRAELFQRLRRREPFWLSEVLDLMLRERNQALNEALFLLRQRNVHRNDPGLAEAVNLIAELQSFTYPPELGVKICITGK
jgi:hypothetical protein